ncbi:MAG: 30S ribosomal protein S12 methylthiotransferase RimO [Acidimicrobiia bacterium]|nr:30S ribosomal protein S12 methylthiotransferase RimO [Acidimicrobiia bacterium]
MTAPTYFLSTLGCAKNQVDSEKVEVMLAEAGYAATDDASDADIVMVNTCAFIEDARRESVETILELDGQKRSDARTVVLGCMAQRFGVEVENALPEVDAVLGLDRYGELVGTLDRMTSWHPVEVRRRPTMDILHVVDRPASSTPFAYVKVAEGCDKPCTFCAIPLIRGKQRSRRPIEIRTEVERLVGGGVSEVVLVAQDLAAFGRDLDDAPRKPTIVDLLESLSEVDGLKRMRLLYLYPREIRPELIAEMADNPKVASYFDLSLQHSSTRLLRGMKRPGGRDKYLELTGIIRAAAPEAALRSSFIVGFPGETEEDFEELVSFVDEVRLDWGGFFPYSAEEGTPAAELEDMVPRDVVNERLRHLTALQEQITEGNNLDTVGMIRDVLVDRVEDGIAVGRSYREAPDIDGLIRLDRGVPREWVRTEIVDVYGPDLEGRVVGGVAPS